MGIFKKMLLIIFCITSVIMFFLAMIGLFGQTFAIFTFNGRLSALIETSLMEWASVFGCFATIAAFIMGYADHYKSND